MTPETAKWTRSHNRVQRGIQLITEAMIKAYDQGEVTEELRSLILDTSVLPYQSRNKIWNYVSSRILEAVRSDDPRHDVMGLPLSVCWNQANHLARMAKHLRRVQGEQGEQKELVIDFQPTGPEPVRSDYYSAHLYDNAAEKYRYESTTLRNASVRLETGFGRRLRCETHHGVTISPKSKTRYRDGGMPMTITLTLMDGTELRKDYSNVKVLLDGDWVRYDHVLKQAAERVAA